MEWEETVAKNQTNTTSCNNIETFGIISEEKLVFVKIVKKLWMNLEKHRRKN